uniref:Uncharacterized protein n=1 Tax=viral metagenome TaxID=1070528 RepID=A0A6M3KF73_9ZZZZ
MICYSPQTALLDYDLAAQYSGEDIDRTSALVNLQNRCNKVLVYVPTIESATVTVLIQRDPHIATVPVALHILDDDATGSFASATTAGTGNIAVIFDIGATQYIRILVGADQTANRTFTCIGIRD